MESADELSCTSSSASSCILGENGEKLSDADKDLFCAHCADDVAAVQRALRNGADVNCYYRLDGDDDGTAEATPLWFTCGREFEEEDRPKADEIVRILLDAGADTPERLWLR